MLEMNATGEKEKCFEGSQEEMRIALRVFEG
jgi:hypothetical protein